MFTSICEHRVVMGGLEDFEAEELPKSRTSLE